jgi:hypothetical protein
VETMTGEKNRRKRVPLDRLTDALVDDILAASDADLLKEAQADDDSGAAVARRAFERASRTAAPRRLAASKRAPRGGRLQGANIRALDPKTARGWLDEFIASHPESASKLNDAPAAGDQLSDEDVYGLLEALQKHGVLKQRSIDQGRR